MGQIFRKPTHQSDPDLLVNLKHVTMRDIFECVDTIDKQYPQDVYLRFQQFDDIFSCLTQKSKEVFELLSETYEEQLTVHTFEALAAFAIFSGETYEVKCMFIFRLFDFDLSNSLQQPEMVNTLQCVVRAMCKVVGLVIPSISLLEQLAELCFQMMDDDKDECVDFDEFYTWTVHNQELQEFLVKYSGTQTYAYALKRMQALMDDSDLIFTKWSKEQQCTNILPALALKNYLQQYYGQFGQNCLDALFYMIIEYTLRSKNISGEESKAMKDHFAWKIDHKRNMNLLNDLYVKKSEYLDIIKSWNAYSVADVNNISKVSIKELKLLLWLYEEEEPDYFKLNLEMKIIDANQNMTIERDEWVSYLCSEESMLKRQNSTSLMQKVFDHYDNDELGQVSVTFIDALLRDTFKQQMRKLKDIKSIQNINNIILLIKQDFMKQVKKTRQTHLDFQQFHRLLVEAAHNHSEVRLNYQQMQFNSAITEELRQNVKYKDLLSWGIHNGVLLDSVYLPAAFDDGLTGVVATQYIPPNKAIICVPYNLIISQEKCKESELKEIYLQNPQLFDEDESSDAEFNILIFYMYREKKRGKESFYNPYIEAIQAKNTLNEWTQQELEMIEDPHILQEFAVVKQDMLTLWNKAEQIIIANQDLFGQPSINDKEDFYWAAESVMSRCFGWSLKSTSMIPVADFLNHSNQACTHNMVHKIFEQNNEDFQKQYKIKKDKLDLSVLGLPKVLAQYNDNKGNYIRKNQQYLDEQIVQDLQKEQKNIDNLKDDEKRYLINQINYNQLMTSQQQIWDLGFCTSTDSEDNDSDEEVEEAKQKQFQHLKQQEEQLVKARRKTHVQVILNEQKQNSVKITGLTEQQLDMIKTVQQDKLKQFNQVQDAQSETSSEESQWDWLKEDDKDAYFAITSTSPIYKNQQVTVSYGRRTNRFLISWYGFALEFNKYSSYNFRLWLNTEIYKTIPISSKLFDLIVIQDVIQYEDFENGFIFKDFKIDIQQITKEFRLKRHKLNNDLIMYLRLYLMVFYDGPDLKEALITVPTFLDYEIFILQFSIKLFNYFMNKFSQSLEEDIRQLHQPIDYKRKFAIYINKERKEILMAQIMMTLDAIIILKKYKENQNLKESYLQEAKQQDIFRKMENLRGIKEYLNQIFEFI